MLGSLLWGVRASDGGAAASAGGSVTAALRQAVRTSRLCANLREAAPLSALILVGVSLKYLLVPTAEASLEPYRPGFAAAGRRQRLLCRAGRFGRAREQPSRASYTRK
jgi:hypothetical protein